ncbi:hypothetical protein U1Q18_015114 [Sarracenia purpurea var. burkii]
MVVGWCTATIASGEYRWSRVMATAVWQLRLIDGVIGVKQRENEGRGFRLSNLNERKKGEGFISLISHAQPQNEEGS